MSELEKSLGCIPAYWYSSNNWGDAVTPYLIHKLSGKMAAFVNPHDNVVKLMVTGSILNNSVNNAVVWGCGIANSTDGIPASHDIKAVRGSLLWSNIDKNYSFDASKIAIGDPCLLLPKIYKPINNHRKYQIGIIPHYIDTLAFWRKLSLSQEELECEGVLVIDVNSPIEQFIESVVSCQHIFSSSLHGLICADAYSVPSSLLKITDNIGGDDFKYKDWFSNYKQRPFDYIDLRGQSTLTISDLKKIAENTPKTIWSKNILISLEHLMASCPIL
jgi:pyruvyltransferase